MTALLLALGVGLGSWFIAPLVCRCVCPQCQWVRRVLHLDPPKEGQ